MYRYIFILGSYDVSYSSLTHAYPLKKERFKILLVDDFDTMIKIVRNILNDLGYYHIVTARNGEEAWQILNGEKFDFIISDWNMPRMNGLELLLKVKESPDFANIPFLMVTAEAEKSHIEEAVAAKVDQYIIKPFSSETLQKKIDFALRKQKIISCGQDSFVQ